MANQLGSEAGNTSPAPPRNQNRPLAPAHRGSLDEETVAGAARHLLVDVAAQPLHQSINPVTQVTQLAVPQDSVPGPTRAPASLPGLDGVAEVRRSRPADRGLRGHALLDAGGDFRSRGIDDQELHTAAAEGQLARRNLHIESEQRIGRTVACSKGHRKKIASKPPAPGGVDIAPLSYQSMCMAMLRSGPPGSAV